MTKTTRPHLLWQSEVSLREVFEPGAAKLYPHRIGTQVLYLRAIPDTATGRLRNVLCLAPLSGDTALPAQLTPEPYDLQSDIHEYGGKPFWVFGSVILFVNRGDKCLYRCEVSNQQMSIPQRVSPLHGGLGELYSVALSDVQLVSPILALAIAEIAHPEKPEPRAVIVALHLDQTDASLVELQQGADFYANLVFDPVQQNVAWIEWQHPNMPWDANTLKLASLSVNAQGVCLEHVRTVPNDPSASYCQLSFSDQGPLLCAIDFANAQDQFANFWNVYRIDVDSLECRRLSHITSEFGYPHWQFGDTRLAGAANGCYVGIAADPAGDSLWIYNPRTDSEQLIPAQGTLQHLSANSDGTGAIVELPVDGPPRVLLWSVDTGGQLFAELGDASDTLATLGNSLAFARPKLGFQLSVAEHIRYPTRDGDVAYAFYYPPANGQYACEALPPALVMVHGGPTARAYGHFDLQKQFWTSSGFAVIDVNHRGSSGYGRHFRDALYGHWGERDCDDIIDGIEFLAGERLIDPRAVCIRGKSAGGYAVLRALTRYPEHFAAGASYYGIGDLVTLAQLTHKFEKHYTDRLLGEAFDEVHAAREESRYQTRSPIQFIHRLRTPMAIFQGALDNIVPVQLAHQWIAALSKAGIEHEYYEYADEAHGFKNPENNIGAWTAELAFYRAMLIGARE